MAQGAHTVKFGMDMQFVEYKRSGDVLRGRRLRPLLIRWHFTGSSFADFLLGLPAFTGYILPAPDGNPYTTNYGLLRPGRLAARPEADGQLRPALRPAAADERSQQPAG